MSVVLTADVLSGMRPNSRNLKLCGERWPPLKGWRKRLKGKAIAEAVYRKLEMFESAKVDTMKVMEDELVALQEENFRLNKIVRSMAKALRPFADQFCRLVKKETLYEVDEESYQVAFEALMNSDASGEYTCSERRT